jgi:hypothetical protein
VAHAEGNLNSFDAILGNDVAIKAEGKLPYPDDHHCRSSLQLRLIGSGDIDAMYLARWRCSRWTLPEERCNSHWERAAKENDVPNLNDAYENDGVRSNAEAACSPRRWLIGITASCERSEGGVRRGPWSAVRSMSRTTVANARCGKSCRPAHNRPTPAATTRVGAARSPSPFCSCRRSRSATRAMDLNNRRDRFRLGPSGTEPICGKSSQCEAGLRSARLNIGEVCILMLSRNTWQRKKTTGGLCVTARQTEDEAA